jgi:hypothetical protein
VWYRWQCKEVCYDDFVVLVVAAVIDGSGVLGEAAHESVGGHL